MSGLNLNCTNHFNKWDRYVILIANNNGAVVLRVPFKDEAVAFVNYMVVDVEGVANRANFDLSGMTDAKDLDKKNSSVALGDITSNALSFARQNNLTTLIAQMKNATASKLYKEKDENYVARCNNLNTLLTGVLADYPGAVNYFTATQLATAMGIVEDFDGKLGAWAVAEADVNNAKMEFEMVWIPKMEASLKVMEGLLPGSIRTTFPTFASSFITLRKLIKSGVRDQGVLATMEDSVTGALFINTGMMQTVNYVGTLTQKVGKTDSLGLFKLMRMKVGIWKIKFSAVGYVEQVIVVRVDRRKVVTVSVKMVAVV